MSVWSSDSGILCAGSSFTSTWWSNWAFCALELPAANFQAYHEHSISLLDVKFCIMMTVTTIYMLLWKSRVVLQYPGSSHHCNYLLWFFWTVSVWTHAYILNGLLLAFLYHGFVTPTISPKFTFSGLSCLGCYLQEQELETLMAWWNHSLKKLNQTIKLSSLNIV